MLYLFSSLNIYFIRHSQPLFVLQSERRQLKKINLCQIIFLRHEIASTAKMIALCVVTLFVQNAASAKTPLWDVVVYGSSPAGIAAATAAGHLGLRVAVYEPLEMIGGMGAAGFLALHDGGMNAITGLAYNFTLLNGQYYNRTGFPVQQPESFVSAWSMNKMLADAGVTHIKLGCRLTGANSSGPPVSKVTSITVLCETSPVTATVFIDASYDGEIMVALDDVHYTAGRESIAQYNESLAGARVPGWHGVSGPKNINALKDDGSLIKYVSNLSDLAPPGEADDALMAFQHRLCVSGEADRIPWPKPPGYNPEDFLLMQRCVDVNYKGVMTSMPPSRIHDGGASGKRKYCSCCGISVCASDQPTLNKGVAHPPTHSLTLSLAHPFTHSLTIHPLTHSLTHTHTHHHHSSFSI